LKLENTRKFLDIAKEHDLTPEQLKYYEGLANRAHLDLIPAGNHLTKVVKGSPINPAFSTKFSKAQPRSEPCYKEQPYSP